MTSTTIRRTTVLGCLAAVVLTGCVPQRATEATPAAEPSRARSVQERWWTWASSEPPATNPVVDRTGADCARNQPDDLWFFAGTFGGETKRRCTVPAGRPIVAPLVNLVGRDRADCVDFLRPATGTAKLDGEPLAAERMTGEKIVYEAVDGNPVTDVGGSYRGTACGLWVTVPPPAAGRHTLSIRGESGSLTVTVDYTFEVKATL